MRPVRLAPWQWLVLLLLLYLVGAEALRLWLDLLWAERLAFLLAALGLWAFINGRFVFAYYHALLASARVRRLPLFSPKPKEHLLVLAPPPRRRGPGGGRPHSPGLWRGRAGQRGLPDLGGRL
jgi:hypothetical protein